MSASERSAVQTFCCDAAQTPLETKTMFASIMRTFDRIALPVFLMLAVTPMLAVAAAASIH